MARLRGFRRDAAIHFQRDIAAGLASMRLRAASIFFELAVDEALAAETGIDAHDQDQIDQIHQIVDRIDRRAGIEHHAGLLAQLADMLKRAMDMRPGFGMHGDAVGAGLGEGLQIGIDRRDHQMHVERLFGVGPQRLHHRRADGDVGHEMAVHHIDMDEIGARRLDRLDLGAQPREIGRQDRRRDA